MAELIREDDDSSLEGEYLQTTVATFYPGACGVLSRGGHVVHRRQPSSSLLPVVHLRATGRLCCLTEGSQAEIAVTGRAGGVLGRYAGF